MPQNINRVGSTAPLGDTPSLPKETHRTPAPVGNIQGHRVTVQEVLDVGSAALGSTDTGGATAYYGAKEREWVKAKKGMATAMAFGQAGNTYARIWSGRIVGTMNMLAKPVAKGGFGVHIPNYDPKIASMCAQPFAFAAAAHGGVVALKQTYDLAYEALGDIKNVKKRHDLQKLLENYDPITDRVKGADGVWRHDPSIKPMIQLLAKESKGGWFSRSTSGGDVWRGHGQRVLDIGYKARDIGGTVLGATGNAMQGVIGGTAGFVLAGSAVNSASWFAVATITNIKCAVQMNAITNIESARLKLADQHIHATATPTLLESAANRMIQERTYTSRLLFMHGVATSLSAAGTVVGMTTGGVGFLAASLGSMLACLTTTIIQFGFNMAHGKTLAHRREEAKVLYEQYQKFLEGATPEQRIEFYKKLDTPEQIGVMELALLDTLRGKNVQEAQEAYTFLHACGISNNTIKSIILMENREQALNTMRAHMYSNRTRFIPKNLVNAHRTLGYVTGITYAKRAYERSHGTTKTHVPAIAIPTEEAVGTKEVVNGIRFADDEPEEVRLRGAEQLVEEVPDFIRRADLDDEKKRKERIAHIVREVPTPAQGSYTDV